MSSIEVSASLNTPGINPYTPLRAGRSGQSASISDNQIADRQDVTSAAQNNSGFAQLQLVNDAGNEAAAQVKSTNDQLTNIATYLAKMKQQAVQLIKVYPPYPPGESSRVKMIRSMMGLRKQIENLTIPPDSKWYGKSGEQAVPHQTTVPSVQAVMQSLAVPDLPDMADNNNVQAAIVSIDRAAEIVSSQQSALAGSAGASDGAVSIDAKVAELKSQAQDALEYTIPGENEAQQKSSEIKMGLEQLPKTGLNGDQAQLLQSLG